MKTDKGYRWKEPLRNLSLINKETREFLWKKRFESMDLGFCYERMRKTRNFVEEGDDAEETHRMAYVLLELDRMYIQASGINQYIRFVEQILHLFKLIVLITSL